MTIGRKTMYTRDVVRSAAEIVQDNLNRARTSPAYDAEVKRLNNAWKTTGAQHDALHSQQQPSTDGLSPSEAFKQRIANAHKGNK
ncbi:hypothetical protein ABEG75_22850 [Pantoea agglomerans]|uniref:hypothetical protein n=1 Tax=Enterobacter agglomerans TaxID=549 RepID=UPI00165405C7|nr:hypothetical protein [Pantoea agglomerans]